MWWGRFILRRLKDIGRMLSTDSNSTFVAFFRGLKDIGRIFSTELCNSKSVAYFRLFAGMDLVTVLLCLVAVPLTILVLILFSDCDLTLAFAEHYGKPKCIKILI